MNGDIHNGTPIKSKSESTEPKNSTGFNSLKKKLFGKGKKSHNATHIGVDKAKEPSLANHQNGNSIEINGNGRQNDSTSSAASTSSSIRTENPSKGPSLSSHKELVKTNSTGSVAEITIHVPQLNEHAEPPTVPITADNVVPTTTDLQPQITAVTQLPSPMTSVQPLTPPNSPLSTLFAPAPVRGRSNSRVWIDFLTEPGIQMNEDHHGEDNTSQELESESETENDGETDDYENGGGSVDGSLASKQEARPCSSGTTRTNLDGGDGPSKKKVRIHHQKDKKEADERKTWFNETTGEQVSSTHVDDLIFDTFSNKDENGQETILIGAFLSALERTGLRPNDVRLSGLFEKLRRIHRDVELRYPKMVHSIEILNLDRDTFKQLINDDILLISKAFRHQFVIPDFQRFCLHIEEIYLKCKGIKSGEAASYIPQLARADPNWWGVSLCTIDGQRYSVGDTRIPYTIQSCSKSLTYGICLDELGEDGVHEYIGQEPSGRMFNEIVLDQRRKPHNPMINAGAIVTCSLLKQLVHPKMSTAEKFDFTYNYFKSLAGGEYIGFDNATFLSEREVADRNYALGFYMRENKCFPDGTKLKECLDFYFQICSLECNCESAAVIAATLANGGICPVSEEKILKPDSVRDVLALMHSCGMYDYSGQFAFQVGLPAKSGVSGIVMVIVPNVLGIAVWSPPLDKYGNSVRGVAFCQELVKIFNFHKYDELKNVSHKLDPRKRNFETKGLNIVNLLFSAALGDIDSIRRHHLSGMDMNVGDYDGRTALHLAAAEGHYECVNYLIHHCNLTTNPVDAWGHLPIDDAKRSGHTEIVQLLSEWVPKPVSSTNKGKETFRPARVSTTLSPF